MSAKLVNAATKSDVTRCGEDLSLLPGSERGDGGASGRVEFGRVGGVGGFGKLFLQSFMAGD